MSDVQQEPTSGPTGPVSSDRPAPDRPSPNRAADRPSLADVQFLTVAEVAQILRVSKMSVYRLIHSGELEAVRFGRSFRVEAAKAHAYVRESYFEAG